MGKELTEKQKAIIKEVHGFTERCIQSAKIIHTGGYVPPFVELMRMEIDRRQTLARVMAIQLSPSKPFPVGGVVSINRSDNAIVQPVKFKEEVLPALKADGEGVSFTIKVDGNTTEAFSASVSEALRNDYTDE